MSFDRIEHTTGLFHKIKFYTIYGMVRCFFLLIYFLVVEDYELPENISHFLSVPLTLECGRILSGSISFFFSTLFASLIIFCVRFLTTLNLSCDKQSGLSQQVEMAHQL